jgi:hypothetical protein
MSPFTSFVVLSMAALVAAVFVGLFVAGIKIIFAVVKEMKDRGMFR